MENEIKLMNILKLFLWIGVCFALQSCGNRMQTISQKPSTYKVEYLFGQIDQIQSEKDGYSLVIEGANNERYFAVLSVANMTEGEIFNSPKLGNHIAYQGEWSLDQDRRFTVRRVISENTIEYKLTGYVLFKEDQLDGTIYTVQDDQGRVFKALVSIPNLIQMDTYASFEKGDKVWFTGELWFFQSAFHITVRSINNTLEIK